MNCKYCGAGIRATVETCDHCGAPVERILVAIGKSEPGMCVCGYLVTDEIAKYTLKNIVCHNCFKVFSGTFRAKYDCDLYYSNGQITHYCNSSGLSCPHCGTILTGHEFYHGLLEEDGVEALVELALKTKK